MKKWVTRTLIKCFYFLGFFFPTFFRCFVRFNVCLSSGRHDVCKIQEVLLFFCERQNVLKTLFLLSLNFTIWCQDVFRLCRCGCRSFATVLSRLDVFLTFVSCLFVFCPGNWYTSLCVRLKLVLFPVFVFSRGVKKKKECKIRELEFYRPWNGCLLLLCDHLTTISFFILSSLQTKTYFCCTQNCVSVSCLFISLTLIIVGRPSLWLSQQTLSLSHKRLKLNRLDNS